MSDPSFEIYWNRVFALMKSQHAERLPGWKFDLETLATFPMSDLKLLMSAAFREGKNTALELTQSN